MPRRPAALLALFAPLLVLGLSGCMSADAEDGRPGAGESSDRVQLREARDRWEAGGSTDYDWSYERSCFCPGVAFDLRVRDGEAAGSTARPSDSGGLPPEDTTGAEPAFMTVEGLFDVIEAALEQDGAQVHAEYDEETGLPISLGVDPDEETFDDEYGYSVTAFSEVTE